MKAVEQVLQLLVVFWLSLAPAGVPQGSKVEMPDALPKAQFSSTCGCSIQLNHGLCWTNDLDVPRALAPPFDGLLHALPRSHPSPNAASCGSSPG